MKPARVIAYVSSALVIFLLGFVLVTGVSADGGQYGQYGSGVEEPEEQPQEEVVHTTVDADLGDSLLLIAGITGGLAVTLLGAARATQRVYFLD